MKMDEHMWFILAGILVLFIFWQGCKKAQTKIAEHQARAAHPEWTKDANIYEVNIRQYTPEGTLTAFEEHLPRLKKMGVEILWLMPIHPIGEKNRKGELGSYYSIKDYQAVNPRFGTLADFKSLVDAAHEHDMKLIMDWVPNHTAWDHPWVEEHPEFYAKDSTGAITYEADWTDIALLNYDNKQLWPKMIDAMKYWVKEADIDGFRVDHASHEIPMKFWKKAIPAVNEEKEDLFWLAEWDDPKLHPYFDASYTWGYFHLTTDIAAGDEPLSALTEYMATQDSLYPDHAYRMYFTTNHDENSWNGTEEELFGDNFENFAVLAATIDGIPLIYGGQETGFEKRLEFFQKDTIQWDDYEYEDFYNTLLDLKKNNEALWNGQYGGELQILETGDAETYAYKRTKKGDEVLVILNFSDKQQAISLAGLKKSATYANVFESGDHIEVPNGGLTLDAHDYLVLQKKGKEDE